MKVIFFVSLFQKHKLFLASNSQQYWILIFPGKEKYFHWITKSISSANQLYIHSKEDGEILASVMALYKEDGIPIYTPWNAPSSK